MENRDIDEWLWHLGSEIQRLRSEGISSPPKVARKSTWEPLIDLFETPNQVIVKVEIAGIQPKNMKVTLRPEEHQLVLKGARWEEDFEESRQKCYQLEISYGEFEREINLPSLPLTWDQIRIQYRDGFLFILIPKDTKKIESIIIEKIFTIKND